MKYPHTILINCDKQGPQSDIDAEYSIHHSDHGMETLITNSTTTQP